MNVLTAFKWVICVPCVIYVCVPVPVWVVIYICVWVMYAMRAYVVMCTCMVTWLYMCVRLCGYICAWHGDLMNYAHVNKVGGKLWIKLVRCVNKVVDKLGQVVKKTFSDFGDKLWISRGKIVDSLGISGVVKDNHRGNVRGELWIKLWVNCEYGDKVVDKCVNNEIENVFKIL